MKTEKTTWTVPAVILKSIAVVAVVLFLVIGGRTAYQFTYQVFANQALSDPPGKEVAITVQDGENVAEVAEVLEQMGVIRDALVFRVQERFSEYRGVIRTGTYHLNSAQTPDEIIQVLTGTPSVEEE